MFKNCLKFQTLELVRFSSRSIASGGQIVIFRVICFPESFPERFFFISVFRLSQGRSHLSYMNVPHYKMLKFNVLWLFGNLQIIKAYFMRTIATNVDNV